MNNSCEELEKVLIDYLVEDEKQIFKISKVAQLDKYKYSLLLELKRINPSGCSLCLDFHVSDNAYMTLNIFSRRVYFYCYRYDSDNYIYPDSDENKVRFADLTYDEVYDVAKLYFPDLYLRMEPPEKIDIF